MKSNKEALSALKAKPKVKKPSFTDAKKRDKRVTVYLTADELERLKEEATKAGFVSVSAFLVNRALYQ